MCSAVERDYHHLQVRVPPQPVWPYRHSARCVRAEGEETTCLAYTFEGLAYRAMYGDTRVHVGRGGEETCASPLPPPCLPLPPSVGGWIFAICTWTSNTPHWAPPSLNSAFASSLRSSMEDERVMRLMTHWSGERVNPFFK